MKQPKKSHHVIIIFVVCLFLLFISANLAAQMLVPQVLETECSRLLGVPVTVEKAGINFLNASFWIKGFEMENSPKAEEKVFLSFRHLTINLSFTSLLARQLIVEKIKFQEPTLNLERNASGEFNLDHFSANLRNRFRPQMKLGRQHFFTGYEIHQFSVKNGAFRYVDNSRRSEKSKRWSLHHFDFSFSHFAYPPQFVDPVPTSLYLNAKVSGIREGNILILGSGNFFAGKRNFRVRSDLKNILLRDLNPFLPVFPLLMTDGFLDLKSVVYSKNDWFTMTNEVQVEDLRLKEKPGFEKIKTVFGFPKKDVIFLFDTIRGRPFDFNFAVTGNMEDPSFRPQALLKEALTSSIQDQLEHALSRFHEKTIFADEGNKKQAGKPQEAFRQTIEQWTGIKLPRGG